MENKDHITLKREATERTSVLANERTYAAWLRTGLTAFAAGLGIEKFLGGGSLIPDHLIRVMSVSLLSVSAFCFYLAAWRYHHVSIRMESTHVSGAPIALLIFLSGLMVAISILALVGLWL